RRISRRQFPTDNGSFSNRIPMVMAERAGLGEDAMTRDDECDRVGADGAADSAGGLGLTDRLGESSVSCPRTGRNLQQGAPDAELKLSSSNKSAKRSIRFRVSIVIEDLRSQFGDSSIIAVQFRLRPLSG